ncbi:MAG: hypothetical protein SFV54_25435 [Bryobacteraceae bacterium]|nr:hypothetical protein [Bryobacteraceae bacterium]
MLAVNTCAGFDSSIPLAAKAVEELGAKTGTWMTTVSYDAAAINAARQKALLEFVRRRDK